MKTTVSKKLIRSKRRARIRAKIVGSAKRPRLSIYRSHTSLTAQVIDDEARKTVFAVRIVGKTKEKAKEVGLSIGEKAKKAGIRAMVFDRGGYKYHGVIQAIADAVREGGITI